MLVGRSVGRSCYMQLEKEVRSRKIALGLPFVAADIEMIDYSSAVSYDWGRVIAFCFVDENCKTKQ